MFLWTCNSKEGTRERDHHREGQRKEKERLSPQHHGSRTSRALQGWHCKRLWEQQRIGRDGEESYKPQHRTMRHLTEREREMYQAKHCKAKRFSTSLIEGPNVVEIAQYKILLFVTLQKSIGMETSFKQFLGARGSQTKMLSYNTDLYPAPTHCPRPGARISYLEPSLC